MTGAVYAGGFLAIAVFFPPVLPAMLASSAYNNNETVALAVYYLFFVPNLALLGFVWSYNSHPNLSFWKGLCVISASMMSGCASLTLIYIFPVLAVAYLMAAANAITGLSRGKAHAQERWIAIVEGFFKSRLRS